MYSLWKQVDFWCDGGVCDFPREEATAELVDDFDVDRLLLVNPASWWESWIVEQHFDHLSEGREGFADLFLERHWYPKFYVDAGDDVPRILDGWHRSAADVLTGEKTSRAAVISRRPDLVLIG